MTELRAFWLSIPIVIGGMFAGPLALVMGLHALAGMVEGL